ncbi:transporter substrate-binding domain-containing protein [Burkholderia sp. SCN-KJ]|uniref:transporter substrate-binding domain-containing protein n=1 Tax=Burkholderia sp. SCN-KJ TaxID=2969248 RepID=UPI0021506A2A|nr:transporter substrate-binding domain-containing protein [Burkholderia sp. SCN-KJ]MCR4466211.1 transporter substrate-binding domain-containing protein [Burkholderia sp. SCN-KJ]
MTDVSKLAADATRELAPSGALRAAINYGNPILARRNAESGELNGISVDLAYGLARELGLEAELVPFGTANEAFEAIASGHCAVGFLAIDPARGMRLDYSAAYALLHGGYLVPSDSAFITTHDIDRAGVRVAAGRNTAYDLFLSRTLQHAEIVHSVTSVGAVQLLLEGKADVAAGIYKPLAEFASTRSNLKMADGYFMVIQQAMAVPKGRLFALAYVCDYVERMKRLGFVADSLTRSGQTEAQVAPLVQV